MRLYLNERFDFQDYENGTGNSGFGLAHGPHISIKPDLPLSTPELTGIDLTHRIDVADVAAAKGGSGGGGSGGGGGGGSTGFAPYTSGPATASAGYNITIEFKGSWTQTYHDIFVDAADRLTSLVVGEIQNVSVVGLKGRPVTVDDILITAELGTIDGTGGVLGQAGPTSIRSSGYLPATAVMKFDIADADTFNGEGLFDDIVLHEMSHSLGFGSIWDYLNLVTAEGLFTGAGAVAQYHALGGTADGIPVELDYGAGTAGSHWDEATFGNELMTGFIDGANFFSAMSAASFGDLGYVIAGNYLAVTDPGYSFA